MAEEKTESKHGGPGEEEIVMPTLPMREGWWQPFFNLQGYWFSPNSVKSIKLVQDHFQARPDDVILATYPKCGTTWLKALAFTVINRSYHPVVAGGDHPLLTNNPHDLVPYLEMPPRHLCPVTELEALPSPRLLGTHMPLALLPSSTLAFGCRVVYLCREPKDVLVSLWYHIQKVVKPSIEFDKAFEFFCEGFSFYGPIWEHYLGYWKQSLIEPSKVLFLKYDEMMAAPAKHVKMLAEFLRVPFNEEEERGGVVEEVVKLCSFEKLKSLPVNNDGVVYRIHGEAIKNSLFFRNAKVGDWANYLTEEMAQKLNDIIEEKLKGSGLTF